MGKIILENVPVPYEGQTLYGKVIHQEFGQFSFVQDSSKIDLQFRLVRNDTTGYFEAAEWSRDDIPVLAFIEVVHAINSYYSEDEHKMWRSPEFYLKNEGSIGFYAYPIIEGSTDFSHGKHVIFNENEVDLKEDNYPSDNFVIPIPRFVSDVNPGEVFPVPPQLDYIEYVIQQHTV